MNLVDEIERLIKSDFFFKLGENERIDHVIFIKDIDEAFINPTEEAFENLYKKMNLFISGGHDFSNVAKMGMTFAFRQYLIEKFLSLGSYWENIVNLYYMGHWPIGYFEGILFAI